jgi:peroxiredoxin (alkyl hydroperoxide reductase subunit C)
LTPRRIIRTIIHYPLSLGRNFDELSQVLVALQTADAFSVATPAGWHPGDDVIIPPAGSCGVDKDRMEGKQDMTRHDWFFCTKKIDKQAMLDTILKK